MRASVARYVNERRRAADPISPRGRAAGLVVAGCLFVGGIVCVWSGWSYVGCRLGGPLGNQICDYFAAQGAVFVIGGAAAAVAGAVVAWRVLLRPGRPDGASGWTVGAGVLVSLSGCAVALLYPRWVCPTGYRLSVGALCVSDTHRFLAPSRMSAKLAIALAAVLLGGIVGWWQRLPTVALAAITVATTAGALVYLLARSIGVPW
ncbi:MAG: hypothetical protein ACM3OO_07160 [Planctomycetaceae bacterium]